MISDSPGVLPIHRAGDIQSVTHGAETCQRQRYPFSDEITGSVDNMRAENVIYPDLSKTFDSISHSILMAKLGWVSEKLAGALCLVVVTEEPKSNLQPDTSNILQTSAQRVLLFDVLISYLRSGKQHTPISL